MSVHSKPLKALKGVRILSLCLNVPGPVALMRLLQMGATCTKFEPPAPVNAAPGINGDPMSAYSSTAYLALHAGIRVKALDLKTAAGQKTLHRELVKTDVLITSFRPSALTKLGLDWQTLQPLYPKLSLVAIFGSPGARAEEPGHDLTYIAENNLISGLNMPATLYADMGGALLTTEAVLQAVLHQRQKNLGSYLQVALSEAAAHLALPRTWGVTLPGTPIGGGHAGYQIYPCKDGRVALAALEPHFAKSMCAVAGLPWSNFAMMMAPATRLHLAKFVAKLTRKELDELSVTHDIPLHTLSKQ